MPIFEHRGAAIYYEEHGPRDGDPALVLPGFTEGVEDVQSVIDALAPRYHVIAADLPGSGRSLPLPRAYTPDFYREDALRLAALLEHTNMGPAHVAGFSDGGEAALLLAIERPELVRSLIIWGAAGTLAVGDPRPVLENIARVVDAPAEGFEGWGEILKERYGEEVALATTRSWAQASLAIYDAGGDISLSRAGEISCPVLIIHGEHDPFCSASTAQNLASRISNARAVEAQGVGHSVHSDRPEWFNKIVLEWLDQIEKG